MPRMAQSPSHLQIPQHVFTSLSHLTSRPGVQSTLILSRKDGSIIQTTGLLSRSNSPTPISTTPASAPEDVGSATSAAEQAASPAVADEPLPHMPPTAIPDKPTRAETLAAHIYAFVSSASTLTSALSHPSSNTNGEAESGSNSFAESGGHGRGATREGDRDNEEHEREDEDEVKLLRLRTKLHEVIVIPDRKFLLCVVHDISGTGQGTVAAGGGAILRQ